MKNFLKALILSVFLLNTVSFSFAEEAASNSEHVTAAAGAFSASGDPVAITLLQEKDSIQAGHSFWVALQFDIEDGWHTYWKNPGDSGMPASVAWDLPEGFTAGEIHWPTPERFIVGPSVGFGYDRTVYLIVEITPPSSLSSDQPIGIGAEISWLACSDSTCLPGNSKVSDRLLVKTTIPETNNATKERFAIARAQQPAKEPKVGVKKGSGGLIELFINSPIPFSKAYFSPEDSSIINHSMDAVISISKDNSNVHQVVIQKLGDASTIPLKGILVLSNDSGQSKGFDVDTVVVGFSKGEIALLDKDKLYKAPRIDQTAPAAPVSDFEGGFGMALLFAFAGGMLLNLMPCVLPVISLKIFSFVKLAGQSRSLTFKHGLVFFLGVLISFWALAGMLLVLQAYGSAVGWGFQLQEPIFVAILAAVMFVLGLNLFGLMELGTSITSAAGNASQNKKGLTGSFLSGILATAVATPCTGPFLGSAVGFAVTLPAFMAMLIFTMLGVGMAFPYLLLSAFPSLLRFVPKPGNWMITFKEIMGFIMMATAIWLLWVFGAQTSSMAIVLVIAGLFFLSIACWIFGKWGSPIQAKKTRYLSYVLSIAAIACALFVITTAASPAFASQDTHQEASEDWEVFSPERVAELQKQGIPVFIDFTAKWCLICQANHLTLASDTATAEFKKKGVVRMKADWTKNDPVITAELRKFGRNSVPLYILYGKDSSKQPQVLPQVLTPDVVTTHLNNINLGQDIANN